MNEEIAFIDPFAGIGGVRLGLEKANDTITERTQQGVQQGSKNNPTTVKSFLGTKQFTCVWSNEWDKYCAKIYEKNFGEAPDTRDIRTIPSREIPDHDLLCAGWPCQSFSVAGKRRGLEDTRGTLFYEICRIARDKRPSYLLLENVKGLLSHQNGWTFATILLSLDELGYDVEWQVLNSKDFGVPQNRERVFIVGHLRGQPWKQVFPLEKIIQAANAKGHVGDISGTISTKNQSGQAQWDASTTLVATCLDANYHKGRGNHGQRTMILHEHNPSGKPRSQKEPSVTHHHGTGGGNVPIVIDENIDGKLYMREIVPTLRSPNTIWNKKLVVANTLDRDGYLRDGRRKRVDGKAVLTSIPERRIRRLTPIECERLQGFPDGWTEGVSDTQRYKALGNAVTVNVVEAIGRQLMKNIGR